MMPRPFEIALRAFTFYLLSMASLWAHSPYLGQIEKTLLPEFGPVEFAVLYGDGVIGADPSQVIVFDKDGYLLAATALSPNLYISCPASGTAGSCRVYDGISGRIFEPDYTQWLRGRPIIKDGKPVLDAYPEYGAFEYGFTQRQATLLERLLLDGESIVKAPRTTLFAVLLWAIAWAGVMRLFWRLKRNNWQVKQLRGWGIFLGALGCLILLGMGCGIVYAWLLFPYSSYVLLFNLVTGGLIALILTRPGPLRRRRATPQ